MSAAPGCGWEAPLWRNQEAAAKLRNPSWHHKKGRWFTGESIKINYIFPRDSLLLNLYTPPPTSTHSLTNNIQKPPLWKGSKKATKPRKRKFFDVPLSAPSMWNLTSDTSSWNFYTCNLFHNKSFKLLEEELCQDFTSLKDRTMKGSKKCLLFIIVGTLSSLIVNPNHKWHHSTVASNNN